jgi:hypothetical protein
MLELGGSIDHVGATSDNGDRNSPSGSAFGSRLQSGHRVTILSCSVGQAVAPAKL